MIENKILTFANRKKNLLNYTLEDNNNELFKKNPLDKNIKQTGEQKSKVSLRLIKFLFLVVTNCTAITGGH